MMENNLSLISGLSTQKVESVLLLLDQLNAQLGIVGALIDEQYYQLKKEEFYFTFKEQIPTLDSQVNDETETKKAGNDVPRQLSDEFANLTNLMVQIQYDLYDIRLLVGNQPLSPSGSRIDDKATEWMSEILERLDFPELGGPVLPIGNKLATNFFMALNLCGQVNLCLKTLESEVQQRSHCENYFSKLAELLLAFSRWSNRALREREWFWHPKSEVT